MNGLQTKDHWRNSIQHDGGFTWSPYQQTPKQGYMVGLDEVCILSNNDQPLSDDLVRYALSKISDQPDNRFLGGWIDNSTGKVYYDISEWFAGKEQAITVAKQRNELAIFDLANMTEIKV